MGDIGLSGCTWFLLRSEADVGSDLLHRVPECVADSGQFLIDEPVTFGVPDGDLEEGEATRQVARLVLTPRIFTTLNL